MRVWHHSLTWSACYGNLQQSSITSLDPDTSFSWAPDHGAPEVSGPQPPNSVDCVVVEVWKRPLHGKLYPELPSSSLCSVSYQYCMPRLDKRLAVRWQPAEVNIHSSVRPRFIYQALWCDASSTRLGAVLLQCQWPVAHVPCALTLSTLKYTILRWKRSY